KAQIRNLDFAIQKQLIKSEYLNTLEQKQGAEDWVKRLKQQTNPLVAHEVLTNLIPALKVSKADFFETFVNSGGLDVLITISQFDNNKDKLRQSLLEIIKALLDAPNDVGFHVVAKHSHLIQDIVNIFDNLDIRTKMCCVQILCILCWWKQDTYSQVCAALEKFASTLHYDTWWPILLDT
ncbi:hypothetical protein RFI_32371, partial [Reticulomyxa filosa]